jgi:hypothetical protein
LAHEVESVIHIVPTFPTFGVSLGPSGRPLLRAVTGAEGVPPVGRVIGVVFERFVNDVPGPGVIGLQIEVPAYRLDVRSQIVLCRYLIPRSFPSAFRRKDIGGRPLSRLVVPDYRVRIDLESAGVGRLMSLLMPEVQIGKETRGCVGNASAPEGIGLHGVVGRHRR